MRAGFTGAIRQKKMLLINSVRAPSVMVILGFTEAATEFDREPANV
jgi:hypothetical protein